MATISNTPRPGYVYDSTDAVWYPIGTGPHTHADYITSGSAINPTIVDAKGDLIAATAADTVARLAVGANDTVLTADSSTATGLKWATPPAGGMTLLSTTSMTGTTVTLSSIPQTYNNLYILVKNWYSNTANRKIVIKPNGTDYLARFTYNAYLGGGTSSGGTIDENLTSIQVSENSSALINIFAMNIYNYTDTVNAKPFDWKGSMADNSLMFQYAGAFSTASAITSLQFTLNNTGNFNGGTVLLYGVK